MSGTAATVRTRRDAVALGAADLEEGDQHVVAGSELRRRPGEDQALRVVPPDLLLQQRDDGNI
eukprot:483951-Lingulodinium_polyedra.AAC.1